MGTKICKTCGKEYPYCRCSYPSDGVRWQDVGCSPECAAIYFAKVEAARRLDSLEASGDYVEEELTIAEEDAEDELWYEDEFEEEQ